MRAALKPILVGAALVLLSMSVGLYLAGRGAPESFRKQAPSAVSQPLPPAAPIPQATTFTPARVTSLPTVVGRGRLTNLLSNGTFETGRLDGWEASGAKAVTTQAHTGKWSACMTNGGIRAILKTIPGTQYKLTAWVRLVSESGNDWGGIRLDVSDTTGPTWKSIAHSGWLLTRTHGSDWFKVALSFKAPTTSVPIDVGYFGGNGRTMTACVDDVMAFVKGVNLPPEITAALTPASLDGVPQSQKFGLTGDDPDGAIVRVEWDWGDGTRALSPNGTRTAALPGRYVATVRVADDEGAVVVKTVDWTAAGSGWPGLVVRTPATDEATVSDPVLAMAGSASGTDLHIMVSTDRDYAGTANGAAAWTASVPLGPGMNRILVQATDANGRVASAERLVRYVPSGALRVSNVVENATSVERWEMLEATFALENSAAAHPQFPYDPSPAPGLEWIDGVTVDGLFTPDNWQTLYRRPAFLNQRYQRALRGNEEWLYPVGNPVWTVRFAPPTLGTWKYRIEAHEAKGTAQSAERSFAVTAPTNPNNHGPVRVSPLDSRYFEFADGTPFLGTGHGLGIADEGFSYDAALKFDQIGAGNQQFFRWWTAGNLWGSAWYPWRSRTLPYDGILPATGLTVERAYGKGLAALRLDAENPIMFQGWLSGHAGLVPGRTYRLGVRWRTEGVTGPATSGLPYGATVKFVGWPEPGQTGTLPALIPHVKGDTPWHVAQADFIAQGDLAPNLALILENTTGGAAYVDECALYEVLTGGTLGPQLLRSPKFNAHLTFDPHRGAGMETILAEAASRGMYFKLVISEKQEYLLNHLGTDGRPDRNGGNFYGWEGSPNRKLHEYYWRHLFARFGAYRSVHSWELINEDSPTPGAHFQTAAELAARASADGNPHLATLSTWTTLGEDAWKDPASAPIPYVDFHAYVRGTGWLDPKEELANDSARFFNVYDLAARAAGFNKPVVWGEQGIDGTQGTNTQDPRLADDQNGVWLHKLTWARTGPGGVYPLYWYTDHIFAKSLHHIYGAWTRFMTGIPLTNGRYADVQATTSNPDLRVMGQKDIQAGSAHVWIDNRQHTWRAVVDRRTIPAVSGTLSLDLQRANASYTVTWYNTATGQSSSTETLTANNAGALVLSVSNLATDTAARITRNP